MYSKVKKSKPIVEDLNEYLSQRGNEYSMLGFDINTVIGAVLSKT